MTKSTEKEYSNGKKSFHNIFNRPDGRIYDGEWVNGKQHGIGSYTNAKGVKIEAEWREGKKVRRLNDEGNLSSPREKPEDGNENLQQ